MCPNEIISTVRAGKHVSDMFPTKNLLKKGDTLSSLLLKFTLESAIRKVQVIQVGLKLNGTHQLLVYAYDVNILSGNMHTINKNTEALVIFSKEIGLEVIADKNKYMTVSREQNGGKRHNIKNDNSSFERQEPFKYLGTNLTYQNSIQEINKSRLNSGNACYRSVQNVLSSSLLSKNIRK
jgi:hypothetical protein